MYAKEKVRHYPSSLHHTGMAQGSLVACSGVIVFANVLQAYNDRMDVLMETERVREIKQREEAEEAKRKQRVLDRSGNTHTKRHVVTMGAYYT